MRQKLTNFVSQTEHDMINKQILLEVMLENRKEVMRHNVIPRDISLDGFDLIGNGHT